MCKPPLYNFMDIMNLLNILWRAEYKNLFWWYKNGLHQFLSHEEMNNDKDKRNNTWGVHTACIHKHQVRDYGSCLCVNKAEPFKSI